MSECPLKRAYREYNRKFFSNRLPRVGEVDLKWRNIKLAGFQLGDEIVVNRRDRKRSSIWRMTLLHEMVHLATPVGSDHGKEFQAGMLKLARKGAFKHLW